MRLAALFHDVGKPKTRSDRAPGRDVPPPRGGRRPHGRDRMRALRYPNDVVDDVQRLVFLHLRFHGYRDDMWTDAAVRRYVRDAGPLLDELNELTRSRLHHPQRAQGPHAGHPHGRARGPHRRAARSRRSSTPSGPTSTATG